MSEATKSGDPIASGKQPAAGLSGALVARRDEPATTAAADLSNVVPFARPRRGLAPATPPLSITAQDRAPLPLPVPPLSLAQQLAVLAGSLAVHCSIFFLLWQTPPPLASIGIEAITVDVVLGADTAAGVATQPGESEVQMAAPAPEEQPDQQQAEQSKLATEMPQEVPVAASEAAPEAVEQQPQEQPAETKTAVATIETPPVETPIVLPRPTVPDTGEATVVTEQPKPPIQPEQKAPERKRVAAPTVTKKSVEKQQAAAAAPNPSSGVGVGRSDLSANYNGRVSAHLARHKQYPAAARSAGSQGTAMVSFTLDGGGRVTSARLAGSSGTASIDQEVLAMVRRASPFPAPPDGRGRNFTVPVRFNLR
jgi:protein TonB